MAYPFEKFQGKLLTHLSDGGEQLGQTETRRTKEAQPIPTGREEFSLCTGMFLDILQWLASKCLLCTSLGNDPLLVSIKGICHSKSFHTTEKSLFVCHVVPCSARLIGG